MQLWPKSCRDNFDDFIPLEFVNKVQDQGLGAYEKANQNKNIPE